MSDPIMILETSEAFRRNAAVDIEPGKSAELRDLIGKQASPEDLAAPPYAICRMMRLPNGDYRPVVSQWAEWISTTSDSLKRYGILASRSTLMRLWSNGYIRIRKPAPRIKELHLESYVRHLKAVSEDPNFWSRQADDGTTRTRAEAYESQTTWI